MTPAALRPSRQRRTVATTLLLTAVGASSLAAAHVGTAPPPRAAGMTFSYVVTSSSADKNRRQATNANATVRMSSGSIRMDYANGTSPMGAKGSYVVIDGKTKTFMIVNPQDKAVLAMDAGTFGSGMGAMLNNPMIKIAITNMSFRFKDMGAGETMLGYRTRRVRLYNNSTVEVKVLGRTNRTTTSDSSDQWVAQGVELDDASLEAWGRSFASGVKSTNPELAAELSRYQNEYGRTGLALRTVTWSTQTDDKGKAQSDSVLMQITDLRKGDIDPSIYAIPSDYTVTNLGETMTAMKAAMDSAKRADAAAGKDTTSPSVKGAAKEGAKESAKDALKSGLGGLLKKKKGGI
jgi:hypothetical protein